MRAVWSFVALLFVVRAAVAQPAGPSGAPRYVFEPHTRFVLDVRTRRSLTKNPDEGRTIETFSERLRHVVRVLVLERRENGDHTLAITADTVQKFGPDGEPLEVGPIPSFEDLAITGTSGTCTLTADGRITSIDLDGRQKWFGNEPLLEPLSLVFPPLPKVPLRTAKPWKVRAFAETEAPPSEAARRNEVIAVEPQKAGVAALWRARSVAVPSSLIGGDPPDSSIVDQQSSWSGRTVLVERAGVWPISAEGSRTGYFRLDEEGGYRGGATEEWEVTVTTEGGPDLSDLGVHGAAPPPAPPSDDEARLALPRTPYTINVNKQGTEPRLSFAPVKNVGQGVVFDLSEDFEATSPIRGVGPVRESCRVLARVHLLVTRAEPDAYVVSVKVLSASVQFSGEKSKQDQRLEWEVFGAVGKTFEWTRSRAKLFRDPLGRDEGLPVVLRSIGWLIPEFPAEKLGDGAAWERVLGKEPASSEKGAGAECSGSAELRSAGDGTWFQRELIVVNAQAEKSMLPSRVRAETTVRSKVRPGELFPESIDGLEKMVVSVGPPGDRLERRVETKRTITATRVEVAAPPAPPATPQKKRP